MIKLKRSEGEHLVISPLFVSIPRKTKKDKTYRLNLNYYRNWNYAISNIIKQKYKEEMEDVIKVLPCLGKVSLKFVLHKASNRRIDRANVLCIIEKFFCDALVEYGKLGDDNDEYIVSTTYLTGGVDKRNPRVEIFITSLAFVDTNLEDLPF